MAKKEEEESLVLNVPAAGRMLNLSRSTMYSLCAQGVIPTVRLGKRLLVPRAALMKMLAGPSSNTRHSSLELKEQASGELTWRK